MIREVRSLGALTMVTLAGVLARCGEQPGGEPVAAILSPAPGSSVPVNEPVTVQVSASDPNGPGVIRMDLLVDGVTIDTFEAGGPQASMTANLTFTPTSEGAVSVTAVAFREDGTVSAPATIALAVVGVTVEPPSEEEAAEVEAGGEEPTATQEDTQPSSEARVEAQAKLDVNIRERPGPGCPIIGVWKEGDKGYFLEVTTDPTQYWYKTDYLGEDQPGWVYHEPFTLLEDDSELPRVPEQGCLYCGDGVCSAEIGEVCDECVDDCGVCPYCGDGVVNQASEECDGGGCGAGFFCNASCQCEAEPTEEPEPYCGDGIVQPELGEYCDPPNGKCGGCSDNCQPIIC